MLDDCLLIKELLKVKEEIIEKAKRFEKARKKLLAAFKNYSSCNPKDISSSLKEKYYLFKGRISVGERKIKISGYADPLEPLQPFSIKVASPPSSNPKSWALKVLRGWRVIGVDGSQIYPSRDFNIPLKYVQAAAFVRDGSNVRHEFQANFLTGRTVSADPLEVDLKRMKLELELVKNLLEKEGDGKTCILLDMPLASRHLRALKASRRGRLVKPVLELMELGEKKKIPIIGYTTISYAWDLIASLAMLCEENLEARPSDMGLLSYLLHEVGCRTTFFSLKGKFVEKLFKGREIVFTYFKVSSEPPVRIEMPKWVYTSGLANEVLKVVLAESILGEGYPYVLLRAHEAASLDYSDRELFYEICLKFLREECNLDVRESPKRRAKIESIV